MAFKSYRIRLFMLSVSLQVVSARILLNLPLADAAQSPER
jgi:hypothetical protein